MNKSRSHSAISTPETNKDLLVNQKPMLKKATGARGRSSGTTGVKW